MTSTTPSTAAAMETSAATTETATSTVKKAANAVEPSSTPGGCAEIIPTTPTSV